MTVEDTAIRLDEERRKRRQRQGAPPTPPADDDRPLIQIRGGFAHEHVAAADAALTALNDGLYSRAGSIVRPMITEQILPAGKLRKSMLLETVSHPHIIERLTKAVRWEKWDGRANDFVRVDCPPKFADMYLAKGRRTTLPELNGVVNSPTLRSDGTILMREGYDPETKLLYCSMGTVFPDIVEHPTREDALEALELIKYLYQYFPFSPESHRVVAISSVLTALARSALDTAPMHAFSAPEAGSGKSLLVDIPAMIATGAPAAGVTSSNESPGELDKALTSSLIAGDNIMSIANVSRPLYSDLLCQMLTQPVVRVRVLGLSERVDVPCMATVFCDGNNLRIKGDLMRRTLVGNLLVREERADLREFPFHPLELIAANRGEYVKAGLTILRAYQVSGERVRIPPLASFEGWSRMVREALVWLGEPDPIHVMETTRDIDVDVQRLRNFIRVWHNTFGGEERSTSDVIRQGFAPDPYSTEDAYPELKEALDDITRMYRKLTPNQALGQWLNNNVGKAGNGMRFERVNHPSRTPGWRLVRAETNRPVETPAAEPVPEELPVIERRSSEDDIPF